ncbi:MAG: hypothetical protein COU71_00435 [Parcubacteria group bacterium CG10_big_fil_rev_8_21_14_0_10_38_31]|nr:MAG: hypothetical protein COU71_00435 [Parcubacteria group bacterium CG10_big_fil_rev_8_21_14_0_10_38_31]
MDENTEKPIGQPYKVKSGEFEGPFELLLELIEADKLSINEVSLTDVADKYLEYIKNLKDFPINEAVGFLAVASTLMLLKSRSLLPSLKLTEEEEESISDLEERLVVYRRMKELGQHLKDKFGKEVLCGREPFSGILPEFIEPVGVETITLFEAMKRVLVSLPIKEIIPEAAIKKVISLEEKIKDIVGRIEAGIKMSFYDFNREGQEKGEVIVNFLAVLELVKRGLVLVEQEHNFGNIDIVKV